MEIDELEGRELAVAVMLARGGAPQKVGLENHEFLLDGERVFVTLDEDVECMAEFNGEAAGRPDLNIAQAWELVKSLIDGRKDFSISWEGNDAWWVEIHDLRWCNEETNSYKALVSGMMSGTAPEAICRAFLKAKAAQ